LGYCNLKRNNLGGHGLPADYDCHQVASTIGDEDW
jgi:hypothetical protein